jgi:hypothetical protein
MQRSQMVRFKISPLEYWVYTRRPQAPDLAKNGGEFVEMAMNSLLFTMYIEVSLSTGYPVLGRIMEVA